jgi:DNA polymerase V
MKAQVFALVDCQSFYCSCESVFEPRLWKIPLVVLSNNDGNVVALNEPAKILGVPRGEAFFKVRPLVDAGKLIARSSNYTLYGDLSARTMATLSCFGSTETYSIDEAFLDMGHVPTEEHLCFAEDIRRTIRKHVGLPVRVGIGSTKTLAKLANHLAKQHSGVFDFTAIDDIESILATLPATAVWGIGPRWGKALSANGIDTALQLRDADRFWVRKRLGVVGLRTVLELKGISCLPLEHCPPARRSICVSRSFGKPVRSVVELKEVIATFTAQAVHKLRKQGLAAGALTVFVSSSRYKDNYFSNSSSFQLLSETSHTPKLLAPALMLAEQLWLDDITFAKAGVILTGLTESAAIQLNLFEPFQSGLDLQERQLMETVDAVNTRYSQGSLRYGAQGIDQPWKTRAGFLSPRYTTRWSELPLVRA